LTLNLIERDEIARHVVELRAICAATPDNDLTAEESVLIAVTKMMLVLPASQQNEASAEARGEAFMAALDDVPPWAVAAAIRRWYRGDAGENERGQAYDYHWCPAPAELHCIARLELWRVKGRAETLDRLLAAEELIEFSDEHCAAMRAKLANLFTSLKSPLVGKDGSGGPIGEGRSMARTVGHDQSAPRP
jgi:hypothetical protein